MKIIFLLSLACAAAMVSVRLDRSQREVLLTEAGTVFANRGSLLLNYVAKPVNSSTVQRLLASPTPHHVLDVVNGTTILDDVLGRKLETGEKIAGLHVIEATTMLSLSKITIFLVNNTVQISILVPITGEAFKLFRINPLAFWEEGELVKIANLSDYLVQRGDLPYAVLSQPELELCATPADRIFICSHQLGKLDFFPCEHDVFTRNQLLRCVLRGTKESCVVHRISPTRFFLNNFRNVSIAWSCPGCNVTQFVQENTWIDIDPVCSLAVQGMNIWPLNNTSGRPASTDGDVEDAFVPNGTDAKFGNLELQPPGFALDTGFARFFGSIGGWVQTNTEKVAETYEVIKMVFSPWTYVKILLAIMLFFAACLLGGYVWKKLC